MQVGKNTDSAIWMHRRRFPDCAGIKRNPYEERLLWSRLRANGLGYAFRKQQALGFYFADFVCLEKKLVIELDGSQHAGSEYDAARDAELRARGFTVLRFWNNEVRENLEGVLERIAEALA